MKLMVATQGGILTPDKLNRTFPSVGSWITDMKKKPENYTEFGYTLWVVKPIMSIREERVYSTVEHQIKETNDAGKETTD